MLTRLPAKIPVVSFFRPQMQSEHHRARTSQLLSTALCLGAAGLIAPAQQPRRQASSNIIQVEVRQVLVPVVVTRGHGHNVTGLKRSDFRIFEDGVPQEIVGFGIEMMDTLLPIDPELLDVQRPSRGTIQSPQPQGPRPVQRSYLVCLDTMNSIFQHYSPVRKTLEKLFQHERPSNSQYGLVALGRGVSVVRKATRAPEDILKAIQSGELDRKVWQDEIRNLEWQEHELTSMLDRYCERCRCDDSRLKLNMRDLDSGMGSVCGGMLKTIMSFAASAAQERSIRGRQFLRNLRSLVLKLAQQPGKRILLLVSDGFAVRAGHDLYALIGAYLNAPATVLRNPGDSLEEELRRVTEAATRLDIPIYTLDSRGLVSPTSGLFDADRQGGWTVRNPARVAEIASQRSLIASGRQDPLIQLATVTGGVFVGNTNDLLRGMRQAFADGREYYVLSYVPTNRAAEGKFRKIRIEVKNKKLTVRGKQGYWAPGLPHDDSP
jgi:VWFA-related protein